MQRIFKAPIVVMALATALAVLASPAVQAAPPQSASGDFVVGTPTFVSMEPKGEICHIDLTTIFWLEGAFEGHFVADFFIIHLGPCGVPAPEHFIAAGTFMGEVDGAAGSFDFVFVGDIDAEGFAEGDLVIGRGTDELKNLSGRITLRGTAGVDGSYEGRVHFAP